jgi:hypothetical protein
MKREHALTNQTSFTSSTSSMLSQVSDDQYPASTAERSTRTQEIIRTVGWRTTLLLRNVNQSHHSILNRGNEGLDRI